MPNPADREGTFRCEIIDYGIEESAKAESQSVLIPIRVKLTEIYHEGQWMPWAEYDQEAYGRVCVVKKDGNLNQSGCDQLMKNAGWDGDFGALGAKSWIPQPCQVRLEAEEYNGKTQFKIAFVSGFDATPGGAAMAVVAPDKVKSLQARFGAGLRAMRGSAAMNSKAPPKGKPPAPSPSVAAQAPPTQAELAALPAHDPEVPF
jgi:hypothetical protein